MLLDNLCRNPQQRIAPSKINKLHFQLEAPNFQPISVNHSWRQRYPHSSWKLRGKICLIYRFLTNPIKIQEGFSRVSEHTYVLDILTLYLNIQMSLKFKHRITMRSWNLIILNSDDYCIIINQVQFYWTITFFENA